MSNPSIASLKHKVEAYQESLKGKSGHMVRFSEAGPVGMSVIYALVEAIEAQAREIEELKTTLANLRGLS